MNILLTGGLGFIGSHVASVLGQDEKNKIIIIDNLDNSEKEVLDKIKLLVKYPKHVFFIEGDILDSNLLENVFNEHKINSIIHFASLKSVAQSMNDPLLYYDKNINGLLTLLKTMKRFDCKKIIFSSSATVYGNECILPLKETDKIGSGISNPYGQTKFFQEQILQDYIRVNPDCEITILRYFNPVGAHPSGLIGENPKGIPNNLFPYILRVAIKVYPQLTVYGNDYETKDGSCIRDYVHVMDLADGHVIALNNTKRGINIYNLGTGNGYSVLEFIETFKRTNSCDVPYIISNRRDGDLQEVYANVDKIKNELGWKAIRSLEEICKDGYNFIKKNNE